MKIASIPANESQRLAALHRYEILDTEMEQCFDELTQLASAICGTPIASLTLIDSDRQWFKSRFGIDAVETPRSMAFCAHGILNKTPLVVPDTLQDERFVDNPFVVGDPKVRFYAGVPLLTADDLGIGMLCVIDRVPRQLTPEQLLALEVLGRQAMAQIELRNHLRVQQLMQDELHQTKEQFRQILDAISELVLCKGKDSKIVWANKAFRDYYGMTNDQLKGIIDAPHKKQDLTAQYIRDDAYVLSTGNSLHIPDELVVRHDGVTRHFDTIKTPIKNTKGEAVMSVGVSRDITNWKEMEEQLRQSEKLAGVGLLAAGVAHELNNPLTGIIGFAQVLLADQTLTLDQKTDLEVIHTQSQRCRTIIQNLLQFCRRTPTASKQAIDLPKVVSETLGLIRYQLTVASVEVQELYPKTPLMVWADSSQIQQVILNLVTNASQALEKSSRKAITISVESIGDMVRLSITDTGPGVPDTIKDKIFDPFFTTKDTGEGTGLGLSICYGIVKDHKGKLWVEAAPGTGATMTVELPKYQAEAIAA